MSIVRRLGVPLAAAMIAALIATSVAPIRLSAGNSSFRRDSDMKPLVGVHEFMEHIIEGTFATTKQGLSTLPADAKSWRAIRDASLLLGESGNLLLIRKPADADAAEWASDCLALRESGEALSNAAKAKNYEASRAGLVTVVQACNRCHTKYGDDGEPKIQP